MIPAHTLSPSLEDYLEAIALIIERKGHAHTKDIAEGMNVKMPSATNAIQALAERGYVQYQSHTPVVLTASGAERAGTIRRRHESLSRFFRQILLLPDAEAEKVACGIEHLVNEPVSSRLVALSSAILERQDTAGLRDYLDQTMPGITASNDRQLLALSTLPAGRSGIVVAVAESLRGIEKFTDLGIVPGSLVEIEGKAPLGDLLIIKVMGSRLTIRQRDAAYIWLKTTETGEA